MILFENYKTIISIALGSLRALSIGLKSAILAKIEKNFSPLIIYKTIAPGKTYLPLFAYIKVRA